MRKNASSNTNIDQTQMFNDPSMQWFLMPSEARDILMKEDDTEIGRSRHRHVLVPYASKLDGSKWTHTDTDISAEFTEVQAVANAIWTDDIKAEYKTWKEAQGI